MRNLLALASAAALASVSVAAAADAPVVKPGALVISSDGKRLGRVDTIRNDQVGLIVESKYVYLPITSLSAGEKGRLVTNMTAREVRK